MNKKTQRRPIPPVLFSSLLEQTWPSATSPLVQCLVSAKFSGGCSKVYQFFQKFSDAPNHLPVLTNFCQSLCDHHLRLFSSHWSFTISLGCSASLYLNRDVGIFSPLSSFAALCPSVLFFSDRSLLYLQNSKVANRNAKMSFNCILSRHSFPDAGTLFASWAFSRDGCLCGVYTFPRSFHFCLNSIVCDPPACHFVV